MLEAQLYEDNAFVNLTYADDELPKTSRLLATLDKRDVQLWWKRLRKAYAPRRLRYFLAGEYGDETFRPHYHAAVFNFPTCARGRTLRRPGSQRPLWRECCHMCRLVGDTWGKGDVDLGILETSSAQYVCGYVTKKMTRNDDIRLDGRWPEFSLKSLGLGSEFLHEVASVLLKFNLDTSQSDVPVTLRHGNRELPLGRFLRMRLRKLIGKDEKAPKEVLEFMEAQLRPLREGAFDASKSFKSALQEEMKPRIARFNARQSIFKSRRDTL